MADFEFCDDAKAMEARGDRLQDELAALKSSSTAEIERLCRRVIDAENAFCSPEGEAYYKRAYPTPLENEV